MGSEGEPSSPAGLVVGSHSWEWSHLVGVCAKTSAQEIRIRFLARLLAQPQVHGFIREVLPLIPAIEHPISAGSDPSPVP